MIDRTPLWKPSKARIAAANLTAFMHSAERRWGVECADYDALHRWSVTHPEQFWTTLWDFAGVVAESAASACWPTPTKCRVRSGFQTPA